MENDLERPESGMMTLFTKTLLILYSGMLAFMGGKADASPLATGTALPLDDVFIAQLKLLKRKPQLVLKLNFANPMASKAMMHTSHRSHSSHSSHYSSSSGGHSSHVSHSSHYSSSSYSPSSGSSYIPTSPTYTRPKPSSAHWPRRSSGSSLPSYRSRSVSPDTEFVSVYSLGDRVLRLGDRGVDVIELQQLLLVAGYQVGADGDFGLGTNAAVKTFQASQGLSADGVVGPGTISALRR